MGYCTYTVNKRTGGVVAAWIGTGTDVGRQVTVNYLKRTVRPNLAEDKKLKCADVRRQFCIEYTGNANCDRGTFGKGENLGRTKVVNPSPIDSIAKAINDTINSVLNLKPTGTTVGGNKNDHDKIVAGNIQKEKEENERFVKNLQDKGIPDLCSTLPPPFNDCYVTGITAMGIVGAIILIMVVLK